MLSPPSTDAAHIASRRKLGMRCCTSTIATVEASQPLFAPSPKDALETLALAHTEGQRVLGEVLAGRPPLMKCYRHLTQLHGRYVLTHVA